MMKYTVTVEEIKNSDLNGYIGICLACGERQAGVEPDAHGYECEACGEAEVVGLEDAVICGLADLVG